jgi:3-hydroxyacyl-CoA dehydrogenase/enoyl-CoA hydratase/3-hydroxybutyryl-CoA epimerase
MPGKSMNVIDEVRSDDLNTDRRRRLAADPAVKGVVITSGKDTFSGGADLTMLSASARPSRTPKAKDPEAAKPSCSTEPAA